MDYADTVVEAIGGRRDLVVVAQSYGGFTAPLVADGLSADVDVLAFSTSPCWLPSGGCPGRSTSSDSLLPVPHRKYGAGRAAMERQPFKQRVRRLKSLGRTESLEVGYRLSPRGEAVLDRLDDGKTRSMASQTRTTTDHDEIRSWVEEHGGKPASVRGTESGDEPGVLRIDFPGGTGEDQLEHIDWEDWFAKFEESKLAFLYQEQKASGEDSTFFKLVNR